MLAGAAKGCSEDLVMGEVEAVTREGVRSSGEEEGREVDRGGGEGRGEGRWGGEGFGVVVAALAGLLGVTPKTSDAFWETLVGVSESLRASGGGGGR